MKSTLFHVCVFLLCLNDLQAQRGCLTGKYYNALVKTYPKILPRYGIMNDQMILQEEAARVYTVPVAVHIVWRTEEEKVSREMIARQIQILNDDFMGVNPDVNETPKEFRHLLAGDIKIRFRLDSVTYTQTVKEMFWMYISDSDEVNMENQPIKFAETDGTNGLSATRYLNIWVGNIGDGNKPDNMLCGYATYPDGPDEYDGAVINYQCFGTPGFTSAFNQGKTVTHEIGHWLNLPHLWGNGDMESKDCTDDDVRDTPKQDGCNEGRPIFPVKNCDNNKNGDLFMDYMDYVDDSSMVMFSSDQAKHMRICFKKSPQRRALIGQFVKIKDPGQGAFTDSINVQLPAVTEVKEGNGKTMLLWDQLSGVENYTVYVREVGSTKWEKVKKITSAGIEISGLKKAGLYEMKIDVLFGKSKITETAPYIFIASPGVGAMDGKIRLNKIE